MLFERQIHVSSTTEAEDEGLDSVNLIKIKESNLLIYIVSLMADLLYSINTYFFCCCCFETREPPIIC